MSIWKWIENILVFLQELWAGKKGRLVFLGLDNAGKTTLLNMLVEGKMGQYMPTWQAHQQETVVGGVTFTAIDVGGHVQVRRLWKEFSQASDAVVFIIDVSDPSRFAESKTELNNILQDEQLETTPLLILGNKIDLPRAAPEEEIKKLFDLEDKTTGKGILSWRQKPPMRPVEVFMCSILKQQGYGKAFRWLGQYM